MLKDVNCCCSADSIVLVHLVDSQAFRDGSKLFLIVAGRDSGLLISIPHVHQVVSLWYRNSVLFLAVSLNLGMLQSCVKSM